ncbi:PilZ domain-containing protein [Breoghania sp.]|uniref:PilZ domain-containing protein n=1 Tax=Breoghania sp. TaxID=2065378 RepID=UPI002AA72157|nr:PilZ domain-containing protein [Breoghania sp.]
MSEPPDLPPDLPPDPDQTNGDDTEAPFPGFSVLRDPHAGDEGGKVIDLVAVRVERRMKQEEAARQEETAERVQDGKFAGASDEAKGKPSGDNSRRQPRRAARLRIGKVADVKEGFLAECAIRDLSEGGAKLIVSAQVDLPHIIVVYDEVADAILPARICWRRGNEAGVSFDVPASKVKGLKPERLRAKLRMLYEVDD